MAGLTISQDYGCGGCGPGNFHGEGDDDGSGDGRGDIDLEYGLGSGRADGRGYGHDWSISAGEGGAPGCGHGDKGRFENDGEGDEDGRGYGCGNCVGFGHASGRAEGELLAVAENTDRELMPASLLAQKLCASAARLRSLETGAPKFIIANERRILEGYRAVLRAKGATQKQIASWELPEGPGSP